MRTLSRVIVVALAAICSVGAGVPTADAAHPKPRVVRTANFDDAARTADQVDRIVIHVTEGGFESSIEWLRKPASNGSSHFVVSRRGEVVQMVSTSDIAWHAGSREMNARSIGIEHEGWSYRDGSLTEAQYRASARLVAHLAQRFAVPIDREHIIAHAEVPHPSKPGVVGGADGHTDPGPYWRWEHYLGLVRAHAEQTTRDAPAAAAETGSSSVLKGLMRAFGVSA